MSNTIVFISCIRGYGGPSLTFLLVLIVCILELALIRSWRFQGWTVSEYVRRWASATKVRFHILCMYYALQLVWVS